MEKPCLEIFFEEVWKGKAMGDTEPSCTTFPLRMRFPWEQMWEPLYLANGGSTELTEVDPPSHASKVSKMPTVLMILAIQQSGLQARPPLGIDSSSDLSNNLAEKRHLSSFLHTRAEPQRGWGLASTAQGPSQES